MPSTPTTTLVERVEAHIRAVHAEIQELLTYACDGGVVPSPYAQKQGDVDVPSCAAPRERGLEEYYGNVNMLLVEAWLGNRWQPAIITSVWHREKGWPLDAYVPYRVDVVDTMRTCYAPAVSHVRARRR